MALQKQNGNYTRITSVDMVHNRVFFETWKDRATRDNPTEFDKSIPDSIHCANLEAELAKGAVKGTLKDSIITAGYAVLKMEPPYNNRDIWEDA